MTLVHAGSALLCTSMNEPLFKGMKQLLKRSQCLVSEEHTSFKQAFVFGLPDDVAGYLRPFGWRADSVATIEDALEVVALPAVLYVQTLFRKYYLRFLYHLFPFKMNLVLLIYQVLITLLFKFSSANFVKIFKIIINFSSVLKYAIKGKP